MGHKNRFHTLCSHLGSGACFKLPCYSLGLFSVFPLYTSPYSSMLHLNPCGPKDPRAGAAGAGAAGAGVGSCTGSGLGIHLGFEKR